MPPSEVAPLPEVDTRSEAHVHAAARTCSRVFELDIQTIFRLNDWLDEQAQQRPLGRVFEFRRG